MSLVKNGLDSGPRWPVGGLFQHGNNSFRPFSIWSKLVETWGFIASTQGTIWNEGRTFAHPSTGLSSWRTQRLPPNLGIGAGEGFPSVYFGSSGLMCQVFLHENAWLLRLVWHPWLVFRYWNGARIRGAGYSFPAGILPRIRPGRAGPGTGSQQCPAHFDESWWHTVSLLLCLYHKGPVRYILWKIIKTRCINHNVNPAFFSSSHPHVHWFHWLPSAPVASCGSTFISWGFLKLELPLFSDNADPQLEKHGNTQKIHWNIRKIHAISFLTIEIHWNPQKRTNHDRNFQKKECWCLTLRIKIRDLFLHPSSRSRSGISASRTCECWRRSNLTPLTLQSRWTSECSNTVDGCEIRITSWKRW